MTTMTIPTTAADAAPEAPSGLALLMNRLLELLGAERVETTDQPHIRCRPQTAAEVAEILKLAAVGQVQASLQRTPQALLHMDLSRLRQVLRVDEQSQLCEVQTGLTLGELERILGERQLSLGPLPPRSLQRTLGAALGAPLPSEAAPGLGRLRDRALRISAVVPMHQASSKASAQPPLVEISLPQTLAPRRATGPDLKQLLIGGGGRLGVITAATLGLCRVAARTACAGWGFGSIEAACAALRAVLRAEAGVGPADMLVLNGALLAASGMDPVPAAALLLRLDGLQEVVEAGLRRHAEICAAVAAATTLPARIDGGAPQAPWSIDEGLCRRWLAPQGDEVAAVAALWPARERAMSGLGGLEVGLSGPGPRLICGVHLRGAAVCSQDEQPQEVGTHEIYRRVLLHVDPAQVLI